MAAFTVLINFNAVVQISSIQITGQYKIDSKQLSPTDTTSSKPIKCLMICSSKYAGRNDYLAAKIIGSYKPSFISSIYEPRTKDGWFNFELKGARYEVVKIDESTVKIIELKVAVKEMTNV